MDFFFFKLSSDMKTRNSHFYILDTIVKVGRVKFSISASCFASQYTCWLQHSYSASIFFFIFLADLSVQPGLCCGTASKDSSEKVSNAFIRPSCFFPGKFHLVLGNERIPMCTDTSASNNFIQHQCTN